VVACYGSKYNCGVSYLSLAAIKRVYSSLGRKIVTHVYNIFYLAGAAVNIATGGTLSFQQSGDQNQNFAGTAWYQLFLNESFVVPPAEDAPESPSHRLQFEPCCDRSWPVRASRLHRSQSSPSNAARYVRA
jgi:hypothetical protein